MERYIAKRGNTYGEKVVLVERTFSDKYPDFKEWVTWVEDSRGNRFWGHYFFDQDDAYADYAIRIGLFHGLY